jgi:chromosome segregation ATPase
VINFNPTSISPDVPATLATLSDLLAVLSDPTASKARLAELQAAIASMQQTATDQKKQMAEFSLALSAHQESLDKASADASAKMAAERAAFDTACRARALEMDGRSAELDARAAQLTEAQEEAKAATDAAAALQVDLQKRLSHIRAAMG